MSLMSWFQKLFSPRHSSESPSQSRPALGRNDPCWCGSGKKYKKCHLSDESEESVKRREAALSALYSTKNQGGRIVPPGGGKAKARKPPEAAQWKGGAKTR